MVKRNEVTGRFESANGVDEREAAKIAATCYYSKTLDKYFTNYEELEAAEEEVRKAEEEKANAKALVKKEAEEVKAAIVARITAETEAKRAKRKAYEEYLKTCDEIDESVDAKRNTELELLNAFCEKHDGKFHDTITIDDITYSYSYSNENKVKYVDPFTRMLTGLFK